MPNHSSQISLEMAARVKALRLQKLWTREQLAKEANVNVYTLKRFERTGQISFDRFLAICDALGINTEEFLRILKPRQRVNINNWQVLEQPQRLRGKRRDAAILTKQALVEKQ